MLDLILGWAVIVFPTALAIVFIFIPAQSENKPSHMKWRIGLIVSGLAFSLLTGLQQSRALNAASNDRESAIKETSARVATDTSDQVTRAMSKQYENTISALNQQIGALQNTLANMNKTSIESATRLAAGVGDATKMQTGGDSFAYLGSAGISDGGVQLVLISQGKYPLHGLGVRVTDVRVLDGTKNFEDATPYSQAVGDMDSPRAVPLGFSPFKQPGEKQNFNIFFNARNGFWTQLWRWRKVDGQWSYASLY